MKKHDFAEDYGKYVFSLKEMIACIAGFFALDLAISNLFYESYIAVVLLLPFFPFFLRECRKELQKKREQQMLAEFLTGMQLVNTSLQVGYAVENAFDEALKELIKLYGKEAYISREFQGIVSQIRLNYTIEALMMDMARRSHLEDICSFAEVFYTAKRTGGELSSIVQNTVSAITVKRETAVEIETVLSGKVMEQTMMSIIPIFILGYIKLTSPGFLDVMYHNAAGILVMSICLIIYAAACLWGRKIMDIQM